MERNFAASSPMEKNICGKRILLFGNVTLLSYSLLSEAYGKMNIALTQHGFARDMEFTLVSEKENEVHYRLISNEETLQKYPFPFCLEIGYRIQGKQIEVIWKVKNTGDKEMYFQIGAHPAFYWPEFDENSLERGFFGFDRKDGLKYILISEKGCADPSVEYSLEMTDGL